MYKVAIVLLSNYLLSVGNAAIDQSGCLVFSGLDLSGLQSLALLGLLTDDVQDVHGCLHESSPRCMTGFCAALRAQRTFNVADVTDI